MEVIVITLPITTCINVAALLMMMMMLMIPRTVGVTDMIHTLLHLLKKIMVVAVEMIVAALTVWVTDIVHTLLHLPKKMMVVAEKMVAVYFLYRHQYLLQVVLLTMSLSSNQCMRLLRRKLLVMQLTFWKWFNWSVSSLNVRDRLWLQTRSGNVLNSMLSAHAHQAILSYLCMILIGL